MADTESLYQVTDEPRIPYRSKGENIESYLDRLVDSLIEALREHAVQINNGASGIVDTYADLPAAALSEGRVYFLRTAGGGPPAVNWWGSDGTNWLPLG